MLKRGDVLLIQGVNVYLKTVEYIPYIRDQQDSFNRYKVLTSAYRDFSDADVDNPLILSADFVEDCTLISDVGV
jgi:hypothetical protein